MMTAAFRALAVVAMASTLSVAGCARGGAENHASAVDRAACRHRADEVYGLQNRDEVYRNDTYITSTRDAPFAGGGLGGVTTSGLSGRYERDQMVSDCLNSTAGNVGATPAAPPNESDSQQ